MIRMDHLKVLLALVACGLGVAGLLSSGTVKHGPGELAPNEPRQRETNKAAFSFGQFELTPRAEYDIEARVLSVETYSTDGGSKLSPIDFAVGWGKMSDSAVLDHFRVRQGGRFFSIYPDEQAINLGEALLGAANMHLIPATSDLRDQLKRVRPGHIVHLRGFLVNAAGPNGYYWNTSLTRTDTGAGACELFYVESLEKR